MLTSAMRCASRSEAIFPIRLMNISLSWSRLHCLAVLVSLLTMAGTARAEPADVVQAGATWSSVENGGLRKLTIYTRKGETFTGRYQVGRILRDITGTAKGDQVFWLAKDVKTVVGGPGGDNYGTIKGDRIEFKWGDPSGKGGAYTLNREGGGAPASVSSAPAPASITSSRNESRVDVLKDQAPNAIEWALAPLERAVPEDIRQSLTFLREDLLDEAAQKPKAPGEAYALGSQLCGTLLSVLEERSQARVRAGFRAVEADARTGVSSQALEARRNYKMSWPQFAREESQRAELKGQAVSQAEVMKERPKVEWATRAAAFRRSLETQYAQFRAALRQPAPAK